MEKSIEIILYVNSIMKTRKQKRYDIHDNGSVPFQVEVNGKTVSVLKNTYKMISGKFTVTENPLKKLFTVKADEVFIGRKSPTGPISPPGNTILFKVGPKYTYIGSEIYEFSPVKDDVILKYYSDLGNSDVPYPYAVGKTHIYIMLDKVAIDKSFFNMKDDIYKQYYTCTTWNPKSCKTLKTIKLKTKMIQKRI